MTDMDNRTLGILSALATAFIAAMSGSAAAFQPDAPFQALQEKRQAVWSEEDKRIDDKLVF